MSGIEPNGSVPILGTFEYIPRSPSLPRFVEGGCLREKFMCKVYMAFIIVSN